MKKVILAALLCSTLSLASAVPADSNSIVVKRVSRKYRNAFEATCAITTSSPWGARIRGTGVVLPSGIVITNAHVVDKNANGILEDNEKRYTMMFIYGKLRKIKGTVLWLGRPSYDLAFIKLDTPVNSRVRLMTPREYKKMPIGEPIFALGFQAAMLQPHLTTGVISTPLWRKYHRSSAKIFFGSSGGGLFVSESGLLAGINSRMRLTRSGGAPIWGEYIPTTEIYRCLIRYGKLSYLEKKSFF